MGIGDDIEVLGRATQKKIPDAAAHQIRNPAMPVQSIEHLQGIWVDLAARNGMLGARDDAGFHQSMFNSKTVRRDEMLKARQERNLPLGFLLGLAVRAGSPGGGTAAALIIQ